MLLRKQEKNMGDLQSNYLEARKIYEPFIIPYIREYIEPPKDFIENKDSNFNQLSKNSLLISESSTPKVEKYLIDVCKKLKIDRQLVQAFVFPKMDIEAFAYSNKLPITIALSAGAVQRLSPEQLFFVIGHEIGHALIGSIINYNQESKTLEDYIFARGMEISADRIGLIATTDIEFAKIAILKVLSGLDEDQLAGSNIHKVLIENKQEVTEDDSYSEHPPLMIRLEALYNLSTCKEYNELIGNKDSSSTKLDIVNKRITEMLKTSVDSFAMSKIEKRMEEFALWPITLLIFNQVKIDMADLSKKLNVKILKEDVQKAFNLINSYSDVEKSDVLYEKIHTGIKSCQSIAPRHMAQLHEKFSKLFPTILYTKKEFIKSSL